VPQSPRAASPGTSPQRQPVPGSVSGKTLCGSRAGPVPPEGPVHAGGAVWAPSGVRGRCGGLSPGSGVAGGVSEPALAPPRTRVAGAASPSPGARARWVEWHRVLRQGSSASTVLRRGVRRCPAVAVGGLPAAPGPGTVAPSPLPRCPWLWQPPSPKAHRAWRPAAARVVPAWGAAVGRREARAPASVPSPPTRMRPPLVKRQLALRADFYFFFACGFLAQSADGLVF